MSQRPVKPGKGTAGCLGLAAQVLAYALLVSSPVWGWFVILWLTKGGM